MTTETDADAFDADGHVLEPVWEWSNYVAPAFRDTALGVQRDPNDGDKLLVDGAPSRIIRRLGGVVPNDGEFQDWNSLKLAGGYASYKDSCTSASWDGEARLEWLNANGLAGSFLFPSLSLIWPREVDPAGPWAVAHFDAYNRFITDFSAAAPERLVAVAMSSITPHRAIGAWVDSLAQAGFRHLMLPFGLRVGTPEAEEFWAAAVSNDCVVHLHKVAIPHHLDMPVPTAIGATGTSPFFRHVCEILPGQLFLTAIVGDGAFDRFPALRLAFHECNAGWVPAWADRARESYGVLASVGAAGPQHEPGAYVYDLGNVWLSIGTGEDASRFPAELLARLMLATDYPHPGCAMDPRSEWADFLKPLSAPIARAMAGENAAGLAKGRTSCR